ncbi:hypothetical protein AB0K09_12435 [Streptomyces sp. NPDC049577]|uniref:hypothetical protein n=1 Tax=Streptomyces sp. NPDC049577 TaxID=3155153 RepID=UPI00343BF45E
MGSLRNPIGPLPSSIYWRRRAVALGLLVLLVLLVVWLLSLGDGGGSKDGRDDGAAGHGPTETTITPGPTPTGTLNTQRPGGRDESAGTGASGGSGGGTGAGAGAPRTDVAAPLGTGDGRVVPAGGGGLPDCAPGGVRLTVRSVKDHYAAGEKPKFEIVVKNAGGSACKVNFGATAAVLKITVPGGDEHVWASDDCPKGTAPVLVELPGSGETKRTLEWDRKRSAPRCGPASGAATPGTYRVEVKIAGAVEKTEFTLDR